MCASSRLCVSYSPSPSRTVRFDVDVRDDAHHALDERAELVAVEPARDPPHVLEPRPVEEEEAEVAAQLHVEHPGEVVRLVEHLEQRLRRRRRRLAAGGRRRVGGRHPARLAEEASEPRAHLARVEASEPPVGDDRPNDQRVALGEGGARLPARRQRERRPRPGGGRDELIVAEPAVGARPLVAKRLFVRPDILFEARARWRRRWPAPRSRRRAPP